jgi:hypothetical protein
MNERPRPPFPPQQQPMPGETGKMSPVPDHGEHSYRGSGLPEGTEGSAARLLSHTRVKVLTC